MGLSYFWRQQEKSLIFPLIKKIMQDPNNKRARHNKSGKVGLSFLMYNDEELIKWSIDIVKKCNKTIGLIPDDDCLTLPSQDGRFSFQQKKIAYGYQIVAFQRFGRIEMDKVASSKQATDLTISHLCGTRNCCKASHIILEAKWINDERTHCHFCILCAKNNGCLEQTLIQKICPHMPHCCTICK